LKVDRHEAEKMKIKTVIKDSFASAMLCNEKASWTQAVSSDIQPG